jgi:hypothetical protein
LQKLLLHLRVHHGAGHSAGTLTSGTLPTAEALSAARPSAHARSLATGALHLLLHELGCGLLLVGIEPAVAVGVELLQKLPLHLRVHHLAARHLAASARATEARPCTRASPAGLHLLHVLHGGLLFGGIQLAIAVGIETLQKLRRHLLLCGRRLSRCLGMPIGHVHASQQKKRRSGNERMSV